MERESQYLWTTPQTARSGRTAPTCPKCQTIHCSTDVVAVGRFDPNGAHGYMPRVDGYGCIYRTRAEAMEVVCAGRTAQR